MSTRFTERMVGRVGPVPPAVDEHPITSLVLPARNETSGDDIVAQASRARMAGRGAHPLDLTGLVLALRREADVRDGLRAEVPAGRALGFPDEAARPVLAGYADLLFRTPPGERRMYYRLLVGPESDPRLIEGVKVVRGSVLRAWTQTTTLHSRVSRLAPGLTAAEALAAEDLAVAVVPESAGVLRIRVADLCDQVRSMRGGVPLFLARFLARLACR